MISQPGRPRVRVGVSACLLGHEVRFNGGHKRDRFLTDLLAPFCEWVPVCPEIEIGMGAPRETIRLVQIDDEVRLRASRSETDYTEKMSEYAGRRVEELVEEKLCGFVLKKDSPSCGMQRVKVQQQNGQSSRTGQGLFAAALLHRFPNLPVEEEGRLGDPRLRENWVTRIFAYHELTQLWESEWTIGDLVRFHTRYKFTLLARSDVEYRRLGRLVAGAKKVSRQTLRETYEREFMTALRMIATTKRNTNVLEHMLGFFKRRLDESSRLELLASIHDYRAGLTPLVVPLTLLRHHVRTHEVSYLSDQVYLHAHPKELALQNYV